MLFPMFLKILFPNFPAKIMLSMTFHLILEMDLQEGATMIVICIPDMNLQFAIDFLPFVSPVLNTGAFPVCPFLRKSCLSRRGA